nr:hypothetical protein SCTW_185 [Sciadococcus taiwanensis]
MLISDDLDKLLKILPNSVRNSLENHPERENLIEVILDLGRKPEARFLDHPEYLASSIISWQDLEHCIQRVGHFSGDNRAGIETTLHRISSIKNREGIIIGLTCRVGRAIFGTISIIRDLLESGKSILLLGKPGIGKTTAIREISRVLSDEIGKRVVIIDTSNEIAGDGDVPHPAIGRARRMQVSQPELQHQVMIEAVENHMPEVIIIDEIGTELETLAARTIAERGVQLVGTAHGNHLESLIKNPILADLIGGVQSVTLSDEEAKRRRTQKSIIERKGPPTFEIAIEMQKRDNWFIHETVEQSVDRILHGQILNLQSRYISFEGKIYIKYLPFSEKMEEEFNFLQKKRFFSTSSWDNPPKQLTTPSYNKNLDNSNHISYPQKSNEKIYIYPYAVSYQQIQKAIEILNFSIEITRDINKCHFILALKTQVKQNHKLRKIAKEKKINLQTIHNSTAPQIIRALRHLLKIDIEAKNKKENLFNSILTSQNNDPIEALEETRIAIEKIVIPRKQTVELLPRMANIRKAQHELINRYHLKARSFGKEPSRKLRVYP